MHVAEFLFACLLHLGPAPVEPQPQPQVSAPAEPDTDPNPDTAPDTDPEPDPSGDYVLMSPASAPTSTSTLEPSRPRMRFTAGANLMARSEFMRTRTTDGESSQQTRVPMRLRARLLAQTRHLKLRAEFQDARNLGDPLGPARMGFHQLSAAYEISLAKADFALRVGRQEFALGTRHLYWTAPWNQGMRSWDALRVQVDFARGGLEFFAGSLANPLLSSKLRLRDHVADSVNLTWLSRAYFHAFDALVLDFYVAGAHIRAASEGRDIITNGLYVHGKLYPGLNYELDGRVQLGEIERGLAQQRHLAGALYAHLSYLTPKALDPSNKLKVGADLGLDFASGSACTSTEVSAFTPCTDGQSADFYSPWMARHAHFGRGDRFLANNVVDGITGVRLLTQATQELSLELDIFNHLFLLPEPGGRWQNISTALIGVDPGNRDPWAADEIDVEATLRYRWLRFDIGWHLVNSLSGGRAISGVRSWQRIFVQLIADF